MNINALAQNNHFHKDRSRHLSDTAITLITLLSFYKGKSLFKHICAAGKLAIWPNEKKSFLGEKVTIFIYCFYKNSSFCH